MTTPDSSRFVPPPPHPSGALPPQLPAEFIPRHVALVMDGNGRWATQQGLPRTEGHRRGEAALLDTVHGCLELGVSYLTAYAFSTENWRRSPQEVKFLMNFNRDVIRRRRDELNDLGVKIRWAGRRPRLWRSVIKELVTAEQMTETNDQMTLTMCVNYGGRAELVDTMRALAELVERGQLRPQDITEELIGQYLYVPELPDVDVLLRPSGEKRTSNFLMWQSAYAEMVYQDTLFPEFDRRDLWAACVEFAERDRRFGGVTTGRPV